LTTVREVGRSIRRRIPSWYCRDSLHRAPVPIYSSAIPLAVLFSAKAGCTFATKWFLFQEGTLEEAMAYSDWPHRYRQDVIYQRPGYMDDVRKLLSLGPRVVKFVRDPYDRAVSSYLHFSHITQRDQPRLALPVLAAIGEHLGRPVGDGATFTFREFISFLSAQDMQTTDPHFRLQVSPCERAGRLADMHVVRIEDSRAELPRLEAELGLPASDYAELRRSPHHTARADLPGFFGDSPFADTRDEPTPKTIAFYDESILREVGRLYAEDIERYGYAAPVLTEAG